MLETVKRIGSNPICFQEGQKLHEEMAFLSLTSPTCFPPLASTFSKLLEVLNTGLPQSPLFQQERGKEEDKEEL